MNIPKEASGHILFVQPPEGYTEINLGLLKEEIENAYIKYNVSVIVFFGKAIIHSLGMDTPVKNQKINTNHIIT